MEYQSRSNGFYPVLQQLVASPPDFDAPLERARAALNKAVIGPEDFAALLSPAAAPLLEDMARRAHDETLRHFGRSVQLFAPLYLANICTNRCVYCGFHAGRRIRRMILKPHEIEAEIKAMAAMGLRRILVLTGDAPKITGAAYIAEAVAIAARHVPSVGIEVQALTEEEYAEIAKAGADGMTMFQETYNESLYADLHPAGPKRNFAFRLDAPQRALLGGIRGLTLGALLGLGHWREDLFHTAMHGVWLSRLRPEADISFSLPRLCPPSLDTATDKASDTAGSSTDKAFEATDVSVDQTPAFAGTPVPDVEFVQALTALRCFLPHMGITLSSRESIRMRDNLVPLGITRISAGVRTSVGGYAAAELDATDSPCAASHLNATNETGKLHESDKAHTPDPVQFVIDDPRSVQQMQEALARQGYTAVGADWIFPAGGDLPLSQGLNRSLGLETCS